MPRRVPLSGRADRPQTVLTCPLQRTDRTAAETVDLRHTDPEFSSVPELIQPSRVVHPVTVRDRSRLLTHPVLVPSSPSLTVRSRVESVDPGRSAHESNAAAAGTTCCTSRKYECERAALAETRRAGS